MEQAKASETDFTLINACGVAGEQHLTALAAEADLISS